jgi:predicted DNA-binding transcriptional regulator AlpA
MEDLTVVQKIVEPLNSDVLFTEEVSSLTRVPVATLRWLKAMGKGPKCGKLGKRVIYLRSDVEAWVASAFEETA